MQEFIQALILGIVQGASEFIPISSSGHLVIVPWFFGWEKPSLLFDTMLHWGTLVSIVLVFWRDFWQIAVAVLAGLRQGAPTQTSEARMGWFIVVGSIPAAVIGLSFKDFFSELFQSPGAVGYFLLVTAALLLGSEWLSRNVERRKPLVEMGWRETILIGFGQAIALAPGISRSGSTIAAGLLTGLQREAAARFSFLLGTPAFLGAGLLELLDTLEAAPADVVAQLPVLVVGFVASAIVGYAAIRLLLAYLRSHSLHIFAYYCSGMGLLVIILATLWA